jgi:hypothetical protein
LKSRTSVILFIAVLLALATALYLMIEKDKYNWRETYRVEGKQPYDFDFFVSLMKNAHQTKMISNNLEQKLVEATQDSLRKSTYLYAGSNYYISKNELKALMDFVEKGNQAFIISQSLPDSLVRMLGQHYDFETIYDYHFVPDTVFYNFEHPELKSQEDYYFNKYYKDKVSSRYMFFMNSDGVYQTRNFTVLGKTTYKTNDSLYSGGIFIKTNLGLGEIFIHVDPMCFTNIQLERKQGFEYASKVFKHIDSKNILWDVSSTQWKNDFEMSSNINKSNSPLEFILSNKELAWAWYILTATGLFFLFFGTKRLQSVIPVKNSRKNTSLQFIKTISSIYGQNKSNKEIASLKMEHFLWLIRNKLHISTSQINKDTYKQIAAKTGVRYVDVETLFKLYQNKINNNVEISDRDLILLNTKIYLITKKLYS